VDDRDGQVSGAAPEGQLADLSRAQCWRRVRSQSFARDVYPDVLAGCFTSDEIADREPSTVAQASSAATQSDVIDAEFTDAQTTPPPFNTSDYRSSPNWTSQTRCPNAK